jgi:hypothetical protein
MQKNGKRGVQLGNFAVLWTKIGAKITIVTC